MSDNLVTAGKWVVGTDGSLRAEKAVMLAAKHVSERDVPVPLLIVHAIPEASIPSREAAFLAKGQGRSYTELVREKGERIVGDIADRVRAEYPELTVETAVVEGHPAELLAEAGKDADQIVVGARGRGAPALVKMLGGTSDYIVSQAQGAIAVIPDHAEERPDAPVVVGLDESAQGKLAIARAFQAASLRGVPLIAISAWDYGSYDAFNAEMWEYGLEMMNTLVTEAGEKLIEDQVAEFPSVEVQVRAVRGRPESALIEASHTAGLVVIGSRGRGGFSRLLLGSTSRHLLRESWCPVIITRSAGGWKDRMGRRKLK